MAGVRATGVNKASTIALIFCIIGCRSTLEFASFSELSPREKASVRATKAVVVKWDQYRGDLFEKTAKKWSELGIIAYVDESLTNENYALLVVAHGAMYQDIYRGEVVSATYIVSLRHSCCPHSELIKWETKIAMDSGQETLWNVIEHIVPPALGNFTPLKEILNERSEKKRKWAIEKIGEIGNPDGIGILKERLSIEKDEEVRTQIEQLIRKLEDS